MSNVVTLDRHFRRLGPPPEGGAATFTVNLDALGRLGAYFAQITALEPVSNLAPGETVEIILDGARRILRSADEVGDFAEQLMDDRDDLTVRLGDAGVRMLGECLDTFKRLAAEV